MPAFGGFSLSPDILARIEAANKAAAPSPVAAPVAAQQFVMPDLFDTGFDYADPFADTTADVSMRQVAPTGGTVGINQPPATPPAEKNRNTIGISPITTEGAVRVQSSPAAIQNTTPEETVYGRTAASGYFGTGTPQVSIDNDSSFLESLTALKSNADRISSSTRSSFDPGNRMPGNTSTADYISNRQIPSYAEYFKANPAALLNQGEDGSIQVMNVGLPKSTTFDLLRELGIPEETMTMLGNGKLHGSPELGEYYTFKPDQPDAMEKYGFPIIGAAISLVNPVAGAYWAAGTTAIQGGDLGDVATSAAAAYVGGKAGAGEGLFSGAGATVGITNTAAAAAFDGALSGATVAVAQGGDIATSALLAAAGGYAQGLGAEAASLSKAASSATDATQAASLLQQANAITSQSQLLNNITTTAKAADAISNKDYAGAFMQGLNFVGIDGQTLTESKLLDVFGEDAFTAINIDDAAKAVNKVVGKLAGGSSIEDAMKSGAAEYIREGGSFKPAGQLIESGAKYVYENMVKPLSNAFEGMEGFAGNFDTPEAIKAIEDMAKQAGSATEDVVRDVGIQIDDAVLQPIKEAAEAIYEPLETPDEIKAIEDAARVVGSGAEDAARAAGGVVADVGQAIKEGAEAIYEPIDAPDIDINGPDLDFNLPDFNIDLSGMFDYLTAALPSQKAPTVKPTDPVYADLSNLMLEPVEQEELLAESDYLERLLRTI